MASLQQTIRNRVFPVQQKGDTLVISPKGDRAGFSSSEFHGERDALFEIIQKGDAPNVIIDLSHSDYFGSEMIGAINSFGSKAKSRGGRFGVCEISDNMREGLAIMRLDTIWPMYPTRKDALRAITSESIGQKVSAARRILVGAACVLLLAGAAYLWWADPFHRVDAKRFAVMADVYRQAHQLRKENAPIAKWGELGDRSRSDLQSVVDDLKDSTKEFDAVKRRLLWVGRDFLLPMTAKNPQRPTESDWTQLTSHMLELQKDIHGDEPLIPEEPQLAANTAAGAAQSAENALEKTPSGLKARDRD